VDAVRTRKPEPATFPRTLGRRGSGTAIQGEKHTAEPAFVKLSCTQCRAVFLLDVEEHWTRLPAEMETLGRKFLGISPDAVLCSRCLHEVETAGAERIYWSVACW